MGNRGTVIFVAGADISPATYLHWNGGPESVYSFLEELERRNVRADADYEAARFVHVVGDFFDADLGPREYAKDNGPSEYDGVSLGVVNGPTAITVEALGKVRTDQSDNGIYVVDRTVTPIGMRRFISGSFEEEYALTEMPASQVAKEREDWRESEYRTGIAERYEAIMLARQTMFVTTP